MPARSPSLPVSGSLTLTCVPRLPLPAARVRLGTAI